MSVSPCSVYLETLFLLSVLTCMTLKGREWPLLLNELYSPSVTNPTVNSIVVYTDVNVVQK